MPKIVSRKEAIEKNLKRYYTGNPCERDHFSERLVSSRACIDCSRIHEKNYLQTENGKERKRLKQKKYRDNNLKKVRESDRKRSKTNEYKSRVKDYNTLDYVKEKRRLYNKSYRAENLEKLRENDRLYGKTVRRKNPNHKLKENIRRRILLALNAKDTKKTKPIEVLLGCKIIDYKKYIEKLFYPNPLTGEKMSWKNHTLKGWHLDHIDPIDNFDLSNLSEQKKAFHFTNTQPLWWFENLKKGKSRST